MELDSVLVTRRSLAGDCGGSVTTSLGSILRNKGQRNENYGEKNENLTHVPSCFDRNSYHRFSTPEAQVTAPRPDAGSRPSVSRLHARHRRDRPRECWGGSRRSSYSRPRR